MFDEAELDILQRRAGIALIIRDNEVFAFPSDSSAHAEALAGGPPMGLQCTEPYGLLQAGKISVQRFIGLIVDDLHENWPEWQANTDDEQLDTDDDL